MDARVALLRCRYPPMGKSSIIVPHMYSDVKVLTGAISPLGWCSFAATLVLFYREGGAKTPCKWCFQPVIYGREIRTRGFKNEVFNTLEDVIDRLCHTIASISVETVKSITGRDWILSLL